MKIEYLLICIVLNFVTDMNLFGFDEPVDKSNPTCCECMCTPHQYPVQLCNDISKISGQQCVEFPINDEYTGSGNFFPPFSRNLCFEYDGGTFPFSPGKRLTNGFTDIIPIETIRGKNDTIVNGVETTIFYPIF